MPEAVGLREQNDDVAWYVLYPNGHVFILSARDIVDDRLQLWWCMSAAMNLFQIACHLISITILTISLFINTDPKVQYPMHFHTGASRLITVPKLIIWLSLQYHHMSVKAFPITGDAAVSKAYSGQHKEPLHDSLCWECTERGQQYRRFVYITMTSSWVFSVLLLWRLHLNLLFAVVSASWCMLSVDLHLVRLS